MITDDEKHVCHGCIGEEYLASRVLEEGTQVLKSYCGEERKGLRLDELADRILGLLQEHYFATPDHPSEPYDYLLASEDKWQQRGDPAEYAIGDMTGLPDEIAANVTAVLSLQEAAAGFIRSSRPNCGAGDRAGRGAGVSIESRGWDGPCQGGRTYGS